MGIFLTFNGKAPETIPAETPSLNTLFSWHPGMSPTPSLSPSFHLQPSNDGLPQASYSVFSYSTHSPCTPQIVVISCQIAISFTSHKLSIQIDIANPGLSPQLWTH